MSTEITVAADQARICELSEIDDLSSLPALTKKQNARLDEIGAELNLALTMAATGYQHICKAIYDAQQAVDAGNWAVWLAKRGISVSYGYQQANVYKAFCERPELFSENKSKLIALLGMDPEERTRFLEENNIHDMGVREIKAKKKAYIAEATPAPETEAPAEHADNEQILALQAKLTEKEDDAAILRAEVDRLAQCQQDDIKARGEDAKRIRQLELENQKLNNMIALQNEEHARTASAAADDLSKAQHAEAVDNHGGAKGFAHDCAFFMASHATLVNSEVEFSMMKVSEKNTYIEQTMNMIEWLVRFRRVIDGHQLNISEILSMESDVR